ncbi:heat shock factor protein [Chloropicon primus]|uniref:Heat shock factor protein n=1 Tax=Chloropicon primus TaxID=1764295 RepID=A0A5B8MKS7_9CHLO|nr:heat shock factor protein [Chloropicon primus]UPQ99515.1 heat shock factor protein [Chloropicon primus]|mmetsp:Transcript_3612/g.10212  ORF Transcript_3612/g.10212 Transcript_3612/m.10212 type:complete len:370 (+) Transcript_3612:811-1920(+)|eukprot:QDZ20305.1 heat shock factor protein [Chloropicon primus]
MGTTVAGHGSDAVPPFLTKTYDLVNSASSNDVVSWGETGKTFIVWKPAEFARDLLPKHFKHNNFSSFVRQLNTYGFRKVDPDKWEFSNDNFQKKARHLLKDIHRRKPAKAVKEEGPGKHVSTALIEVGQYGGVTETLDQLKRDRDVLMKELVNVRQRQHVMEEQMLHMQNRMERAENRQSTAEKSQAQIYQLVQQALSNPGVLHQILSRKANYGMPYIESSEAIGKRKKIRAKRPLSTDQGVNYDLFPQHEPESTSYNYLPEPTIPALPPSPMTNALETFFPEQSPMKTEEVAGENRVGGIKEYDGFGPDQLALGKLNLKQPAAAELLQNSSGHSWGFGSQKGDLEENGAEGIDSFLDFGTDVPTVQEE